MWIPHFNKKLKCYQHSNFVSAISTTTIIVFRHLYVDFTVSWINCIKVWHTFRICNRSIPHIRYSPFPFTRLSHLPNYTQEKKQNYFSNIYKHLGLCNCFAFLYCVCEFCFRQNQYDVKPICVRVTNPTTTHSFAYVRHFQCSAAIHNCWEFSLAISGFLPASIWLSPLPATQTHNKMPNLFSIIIKTNWKKIHNSYQQPKGDAEYYKLIYRQFRKIFEKKNSKIKRTSHFICKYSLFALCVFIFFSKSSIFSFN